MRRLWAALCALLIVGSALATEQSDILLFSRPGWVFPGASVDMDFANGRYWGLQPSALTVSRASTESEVCNGTLTTFAANTPAITPGCGLWAWEARTNSNRNSTMAGAVNGSPGTLPTFWIEGANAGLTRQIATGVSGGMNYIDLRYFGTTTSQYVQIYFDGVTTSALTYGQTSTSSAYYQLVDATNIANVANVQNNIYIYNGASAFIAGSGTTVSIASLTSQTRIAKNYTPTDPTVAYARHQFLVAMSGASGLTADFTIRIWQPQLELNPNLPATVASAVKAADGAGGVNGAGVYTVTGGTCTTAPTLNVTWAAGVLTVNSVANAGSCSVLPPSPATLAYLSGAATGWTGATVTLTPTDNSSKGFSTGPILTTAGAATRAVTNATSPIVPCQNPSLWAAGTPYSALLHPVGQSPVALTNGIKYIYPLRLANAGFVRGWVYDGTTFAQTPSSTVWPVGTAAKIAVALSGTTLSSAYNAGTPSTVAYGGARPWNTFVLGGGTLNAPFNGVVSRVAFACGTSLLNN